MTPARLTANEWTGAPGERDAPVPPARAATQRYRWSAAAPISLHGTCAHWEVLAAGILILHDVLVDTSQRFRGTMLEARVTARRELVVAGPMIVFPFNADEAP